MGDAIRDRLAAACKKGDFEIAQAAVRELLAGEAKTAMTEYAFRHCDRLAEQRDMTERRIALLPSFTLQPLASHLGLRAFLHGWRAQTEFWPYDQWDRVLSEPKKLNAFEPDVVILMLHLEDVIPTLARQHLAEKDRLEKDIALFLSRLSDAIAAFRKHSAAPVVLNSIIPMSRGIERHFDRRVKPGRQEYVDGINHRLGDFARSTNGVFLFDYAAAVTETGRRAWHDPVKDHHTRTAITPVGLAALANELTQFLNALFGIRRKVVAVDLDNTLWGGIVGEDGVGGLALSGDYPGNAYHDFQAFLANLRASGTALAIISKNNPEDAREVFEANPDMPVSWDHFASRQIGWQDKAAGLKSAAKEINVSLDSFIFVDDSPVECELVRTYLPEVTVVEAAGPPSLLPGKILEAGGLDAVALTEEDLIRTDSYQSDRERRDFQVKATDVKMFLEELGQELDLRAPREDEFERVAQLCGKTNQFNLTTKRYQLSDVAAMAAAPDVLLRVGRLRDRFGDNGLILVLILRTGAESWEIDTFLMSCRVLGRNVEQAVLSYGEGLARNEGVKTMIGRYLLTKKNGQVADLYSRFGFEATEEEGVFVRDLANSQPILWPEFVRHPASENKV